MRKPEKKLVLAGILTGALLLAGPAAAYAEEAVSSSSRIPTAEELGVDEETYKQLLSERKGMANVKMTESLDDPQQDDTNTCSVTFCVVDVPDNFSLINDQAAYMQIQSDAYTIRIPATANEEYRHTSYVPEGEYTIQICAFLNDNRQTYPLEMPRETAFTASPDKATTITVKMEETAREEAISSIKATEIDNRRAAEEVATMSNSQSGNAAGRNYDPEVGPGDEVVKTMSEINAENPEPRLISTKPSVKAWSKPFVILVCVLGGLAVSVILGIRKFRRDNKE